MAKTNGKKNKDKDKKNGNSKCAIANVTGRQAAREVWSLDQMLAALDNRTDEECVASAISAGILDENGELAEFYTKERPGFISRACSDVYLSH